MPAALGSFAPKAMNACRFILCYHFYRNSQNEGDKIKALPKPDCALCVRLKNWRGELKVQHPDWFNAPVPCFGTPNSAELLVLGLAPGLKGANRTGRVFTGDGAGVPLYQTLIKFGLAQGVYGAAATDGLKLVNTVISNVVRCVPPENKPTSAEIKQCAQFLTARLRTMKHLKVVIALGHLAHQSLLAASGVEKKKFVFKHGAVHNLGRFVLVDSYHCSRRNFSTKILTIRKFESVFKKALSNF